ncbi:NAD(P)-dependent alcohol dehydrogenase [bacterium]|nr:NAD(P)-dependent alcohol dehydrogenase [bacterium]
MKAITYNKKSKKKFDIIELPKPKASEKQMIVKVVKSTLNSGDVVRMKMGLLDRKLPVTGSEFSGTVIYAGSEISNFKVGDDVYGYKPKSVHAEFIRVNNSDLLCRKPSNISHCEAAALPNGMLSALYFLKKAKISRGQKVLINGASGSVGTYMLQMLKYLGAEIHAVCGSQNVAMVKDLGAEVVFDYNQVNLKNLPHSYDVVLDAVGKASISDMANILMPHGRIVTVAFTFGIIWRQLLNVFYAKKLYAGIAKYTKEDFKSLNMLVENDLIKPFIQAEFDKQQMNEAFNIVSSGRKRGNIVLNLAS